MVAADVARSWLLDQQTGWLSLGPDRVTEGVAISLAPSPNGPLSLASNDGSLGGLRLPPRVAVDGQGRIYLLRESAPAVLRFDRHRGDFQPLPSIDGEGADARSLRQPVAMAISGQILYVLDVAYRRVQGYDLRNLALVWVSGPLDAEGGRPRQGQDLWAPTDIAVHGADVYVLDGANGRVYVSRRGGTLRHLPSLNLPPDLYFAITTDRDGRIYLASQTGLLVCDPDGSNQHEAGSADEVRDRFDSPAFRLDHSHRLRIGDRFFDLNGHEVSVDPYEPSGPPLYERWGRWSSGQLDSDIYNCQWDRIELRLGALPEGSSVTVLTYTSEVDPGQAAILARSESEPFWVRHPAIRGAATGSPEARDGFDPDQDVLILSRPGRFLWLRIELQGDGYSRPAIESLRVHFPRQSYMQYLPAVFSAEEESRWFLERFLSVFQREWDHIEDVRSSYARYLDPKAVPGGAFLTYLADWLALPLEKSWDWEANRRLLEVAIRTYGARGTVTALRGFVQTYLQNMSGLEDAPSFPQIIEGYRERDRLLLSEHATLGDAPPLWGAGVVGRLQLGANAREGEVKLVSTPDPQRDVFFEYAHRFRVFVPGCFIQHAEDERMLRRALDAEKPAHTAYDLILLEPRFRVGVQSTVGIDTVIGDYPVARLSSFDEEDAPSREPFNRLGFDTVLAQAPAGGPGLLLSPESRLGLDMSLA